MVGEAGQATPASLLSEADPEDDPEDGNHAQTGGDRVAGGVVVIEAEPDRGGRAEDGAGDGDREQQDGPRRANGVRTRRDWRGASSASVRSCP